MGGGGGKAPPGSYLGPWGAFGGPKQRGIVQYTLAANRQKPTAGALRSAVFNGWRRFRSQVLYIAPPFVAGYLLLDWAEKRNKFLNSKAGQALLEDEGDD
ncbi:cytochrome b-c1 complex subunit 8 [Drechslerella stenobrocha 248]|uniref:Cytochrome b-c1 complex subunit 8 n=1 Tax=Drechslerella stenobrocha 248 TaxID=1043628 RepID=W7I4N7_9PEZI|nr:cytochrome b-c1 complex subunit 8 [Drechslerella stenobrocha 248]